LVAHDSLACPPVFTADLMATGLEGHFRADIAPVTDHNAAIAVDHKILSDPAVLSNGHRACAQERAHDPGARTDGIADFIEQLPLDLKVSLLAACVNTVHQKQVYAAAQAPQVQ
jgi:hypothetical protein